MTTVYGLDTWCLDALHPGRFASGITLVAQRCYHRLITPRGDLRGGPDEANFGLDLAGMCGSADSAEKRAMVEPRVINELLKDPAVESVRCDAVTAVNAGRSTYTLTIDVITASGPFQLVLEASDVTVELVGLST